MSWLYSARALQLSGRYTTVHRAASHVSVESNERADTLDNEATSLDVISHAEQASAAYSHLIAEHFSKQLQLMTADESCPLQDGIKRPYFLAKSCIPNRPGNIQLHKRMCRVCTRTRSAHTASNTSIQSTTWYSVQRTLSAAND